MLKQKTINARLRRGWNVKDAHSEPLQWTPMNLKEGEIIGKWKLINFIENKIVRKKKHYENKTGKTYCFTNKRFPIWNIQCVICHWTEERFIESKNAFNRRCKHCQGLPKGEAGFNILRRSYYRKGCPKEKENNLTTEQFRHLVSSPCHYCGVLPSSKCLKRRTKNTWGEFTYNGIDRKDSSKHYTLENCVPCCHWCNRAKNAYSYEEYVAHMKEIFIPNTYSTHFDT